MDLAARLDQVGEQLGAFLDAVGRALQMREHFLQPLLLLGKIAIVATVVEQDPANIVEALIYVNNVCKAYRWGRPGIGMPDSDAPGLRHAPLPKFPGGRSVVVSGRGTQKGARNFESSLAHRQSWRSGPGLPH